MKIFRIILTFLVLVFVFGFIFACTTVEPEIVEEPEIIETVPPEEEVPEQTPVPEEEEIDENDLTEEEIGQEELKDKLFERLNEFFDAVREDKEYAFFSSYTKELVGTEEEYKSGAKSDIFFIIKEAHSSWENLEAKDIEVDGDWATLTITGDRMAEGIEYTDEEISFRFVNEENEWKIDFSGK